MKLILKFLADLSQNNNREWFKANKELWDEVKRAADELAIRLIDIVAEVDSRASILSLSECTYRIYRDTRFSPDKSPYKRHIGIFINPPGGKKSLTCGYYFHLEPGNCFAAAGTVCLPSPVIRAIRKDIYDNIEEYISIVDSPEFRQYFKDVGENLLKTAPKGFPKDWEYIDYIRPRDFVASHFVNDSFYETRGLRERVLPAVMQMKRFNDFINYSIEPFEKSNNYSPES